jgi:hypothetical protein
VRHVFPASAVVTREVQVPVAHGATPRTNPSSGETNVTDTGANPAGTAACGGELGVAGGGVLDGNVLDGNALDGSALDGNVLDGNALNCSALDCGAVDGGVPAAFAPPL